MWRRTLLVVLLAAGCGGGPALENLPAARRAEVCAALLAQADGPFGCRGDDLRGVNRNLTDAYTYAVDVEFRANGRLERFRGLRSVRKDATHAPAPPPSCVEQTVRAFHLEEGSGPLAVPVELRYQTAPDTIPQSIVREAGACLLVLKPAS